MKLLHLKPCATRTGELEMFFVVYKHIVGLSLHTFTITLSLALFTEILIGQELVIDRLINLRHNR